jgi:putative ATPase
VSNQCNPTFVRGGSEQINGLLSAFHKSLRGSDPQAALYYAARFMLMGGDAAAPVWRRLACAASEDVGPADPQAVVQVLTNWQLFERVGWPEGHLFLAQAVVYVATAPKTNRTHIAWGEAMAVAERTSQVEPPLHILNAPTKLMDQLGYGHGYRYDHDEPDAYAGQEFLPALLLGSEIYTPTGRGFEREMLKRLDYWKTLKAKRGK